MRDRIERVSESLRSPSNAGSGCPPPTKGPHGWLRRSWTNGCLLQISGSPMGHMPAPPPMKRTINLASYPSQVLRHQERSSCLPRHGHTGAPRPARYRSDSTVTQSDYCRVQGETMLSVPRADHLFSLVAIVDQEARMGRSTQTGVLHRRPRWGFNRDQGAGWTTSAGGQARLGR